MKKTLFPSAFVQATMEHYHFKISSVSQSIYLLLLIGIILSVALTPFIHVDVTKNVRGQISSASLRQSLYSPRGGQVVYSNLKENQFLTKGDTVLRYDDTSIRKNIDQQEIQLLELEGFVSDLNVLCAETIYADKLQTIRYQLEYGSFNSQQGKLLLNLANASNIFKRQDLLYKEHVIAQKEYELALHTMNQARSELELFQVQSKTDWKKQSISLRKEWDQVLSKRNQLQDDLKSYTLLSPRSGTYQNIQPIEPEQFVQGGIKLAEISPDDSLVALCYVSPTDIGLLQLGQTGHFRIDAFDYNEWGMLNGKIAEISGDAYLMENAQPVFQVKCHLDRTIIKLRNGFSGRLKKGMTFNANFLVAKRSIYQLLFDKVDNWMNPKNTSIALND